MADLIAAHTGVLTPPTDLHADRAFAWIFLILLMISTIGSLIYAAVDAWRTRSPLLSLLILGGVTMSAFVVEPIYDIIMATWYPYDEPVQLLSVLGRPMALIVVLAWVQIAVTAYLGYRLVVGGWSIVRISVLLRAISLGEGMMEMACVHFGVMNYYGNHATIFGVPLPTLVQNAGMFAVIGVALAMIVPHLRGWRWAVVPFAVGMIYLAYVPACTWPNFLAIHGQAPMPLFWLAAVTSALMNGGVAFAALHMPVAKEYRAAAQARSAETVTTSDVSEVAAPSA